MVVQGQMQSGGGGDEGASPLPPGSAFWRRQWHKLVAEGDRGVAERRHDVRERAGECHCPVQLTFRNLQTIFVKFHYLELLSMVS